MKKAPFKRKHVTSGGLRYTVLEPGLLPDDAGHVYVFAIGSFSNVWHISYSIRDGTDVRAEISRALKARYMTTNSITCKVVYPVVKAEYAYYVVDIVNHLLQYRTMAVYPRARNYFYLSDDELDTIGACIKIAVQSACFKVVKEVIKPLTPI